MNKLNHERIDKNSVLSPGTITNDSEMSMSFSHVIIYISINIQKCE